MRAGELLNVGSADRGFRTVYRVPGPGGYNRRTFDFKLLKEILGGDGELYLRTSNKGGQRPGRCAGRRAARYRTIQYSELLRRRLEVPTERALVLERALDLATWLDMDRPVLKLG